MSQTALQSVVSHLPRQRSRSKVIQQAFIIGRGTKGQTLLILMQKNVCYVVCICSSVLYDPVTLLMDLYQLRIHIFFFSGYAFYLKFSFHEKFKFKLEFVFYVKTDVSPPPYWSDAVLYRKSGFGTAKGYKLRKLVRYISV